VNRLIPLLLLLLIFGCSGLKREYPKKNFYTFEVVNEIKVNNNQGKNYVKIERVDVSHAYLHRDFNYRVGPDEFISDYYNQFYRPVGVLVTSEIYKWFSSTGLFKDVLPVNNLINAKYILDSKIVDIYGDYSNPDDPRAVLNMQFFLVDESAVIAELAYSNVYNQSVAISSRTPGALVEGWNEALKNILKQFETDLSNINNL